MQKREAETAEFFESRNATKKSTASASISFKELKLSRIALL